MLQTIYHDMIQAVFYLAKSKLPRSEKISVAGDYLKLWVKKTFLTGKKESSVVTTICGRTFRGFDYSTLFFLHKEIFVKGEYFFNAESESPVIFDCGANVGMATLFFKTLYPAAVVHAFEPDPKTFRLLKENIENNGIKNVFLHNAALGKTEGFVEFFTSSEAPGSLKMSTHASRHGETSISVPAARLSSFMDCPASFVKIDTEGAEREIIKELSESDALRFVRQTVIEYHHRIGGDRSSLSQLLYMLEKSGFEYQINTHLVPVATQGAFQDILIYAYRSA